MPSFAATGGLARNVAKLRRLQKGHSDFSRYFLREAAMKFLEADVCGDERLSMVEFRMIIPKSSTISSQEQSTLFRSIDTDQDGCISSEEFVTWVLINQYAEIVEGFRSVFRQYDENAAGELTKDEFALAVEELGFSYRMGLDLFVSSYKDERGLLKCQEAMSDLSERIATINLQTKMKLASLAFGHGADQRQRIHRRITSGRKHAEWRMARDMLSTATSVNDLREELKKLMRGNDASGADLYLAMMEPHGSGGVMSLAEFGKALQRLGFEVTDGIRNEAFCDVDRDESGFFGINEFNRWVRQGITRRGTAWPPRRMAFQHRRDKKNLPLEEIKWSTVTLQEELQDLLLRQGLTPLDLIRAWETDAQSEGSNVEGANKSFLKFMKSVVNNNELWGEALKFTVEEAVSVISNNGAEVDARALQQWLEQGWKMRKKEVNERSYSSLLAEEKLAQSMLASIITRKPVVPLGSPLSPGAVEIQRVLADAEAPASSEPVQSERAVHGPVELNAPALMESMFAAAVAEATGDLAPPEGAEPAVSAEQSESAALVAAAVASALVAAEKSQAALVAAQVAADDAAEASAAAEQAQRALAAAKRKVGAVTQNLSVLKMLQDKADAAAQACAAAEATAREAAEKAAAENAAAENAAAAKAAAAKKASVEKAAAERAAATKAAAAAEAAAAVMSKAPNASRPATAPSASPKASLKTSFAETETKPAAAAAQRASVDWPSSDQAEAKAPPLTRVNIETIDREFKASWAVLQESQLRLARAYVDAANILGFDALTPLQLEEVKTAQKQFGNELENVPPDGAVASREQQRKQQEQDVQELKSQPGPQLSVQVADSSSTHGRMFRAELQAVKNFGGDSTMPTRSPKTISNEIIDLSRSLRHGSALDDWNGRGLTRTMSAPMRPRSSKGLPAQLGRGANLRPAASVLQPKPWMWVYSEPLPKRPEPQILGARPRRLPPPLKTYPATVPPPALPNLANYS